MSPTAPPIMPALQHFFDSDFSKGGGYSACSRVFSWVFLSGKISAIGLFVWYYLLLGMCIEVGDIMFFFCIKNVLISQHLLQHPFCNFQSQDVLR